MFKKSFIKTIVHHFEEHWKSVLKLRRRFEAPFSRSVGQNDKPTLRQTQTHIIILYVYIIIFHLRSTPPHIIPSIVKNISLSIVVQFIVTNLFEEIVRRKTKALQQNKYLYDTLVYQKNPTSKMKKLTNRERSMNEHAYAITRHTEAMQMKNRQGLRTLEMG